MIPESALRYFLRLALLLLCLAATPALAAEADEVNESLGIFAEYSPAPSRFPRPASLIAENHTVVTAEQIERLNAHTVADVLQTLPGFQLDLMQTPGNLEFFALFGSSSRHVLVQIDGVPQNFQGTENVAWVGQIPVQMVERIEVVKGAASAAWGSALGGVINIVTKGPATEPAAGMASGSIGKSATKEFRGEISGSSGRTGYYLTGGTLHSKGLVPGNGVDFNHGFGKFAYETASGGEVTLGLDVRRSVLGLEESQKYDIRDTGAMRHESASLALRQPLAERLELELRSYAGTREGKNKRLLLSMSQLFLDVTAKEAFRGAAAAFNWGDAHRALKGGVEFEQNEIETRELIHRLPMSNYDFTLRRVSAYLSGTYTVGRLSILPGVRLDRINLLEDPVSYTLGATLRVSDSTLIRSYAARGYSMPIISNLGIESGQPLRELQHVRTMQVGVESAEIPYLWAKGTFFYADVWNIEGFDPVMTVRLDEQVKKGMELELRTSPFYGVALSGGYNFTHARDKKTGEKVDSVAVGPRQSLKLGVNYDNEEAGFSATLTGHYLKLTGLGATAKNKGMLWDLHLTQKLAPRSENPPELFLSLRNMFDSEQYYIDLRPNATRWLEVGARYRF